MLPVQLKTFRLAGNNTAEGVLGNGLRICNDLNNCDTVTLTEQK